MKPTETLYYQVVRQYVLETRKAENIGSEQLRTNAVVAEPSSMGNGSNLQVEQLLQNLIYSADGLAEWGEINPNGWESVVLLLGLVALIKEKTLDIQFFKETIRLLTQLQAEEDEEVIVPLL